MHRDSIQATLFSPSFESFCHRHRIYYVESFCILLFWHLSVCPSTPRCHCWWGSEIPSRLPASTRHDQHHLARLLAVSPKWPRRTYRHENHRHCLAKNCCRRPAQILKPAERAVAVRRHSGFIILEAQERRSKRVGCVAGWMLRLASWRSGWHRSLGAGYRPVCNMSPDKNWCFL